MSGRRLLAALLVALGALVWAAPAHAGRIVLVGADLDNHCGQYGAMCRYLARTTAYARGGAPDPARPVLLIERPYGRLARAVALGAAFGQPEVPVERVDPRSEAFAALTLDTGRYSAIVIGSDDHCGVGRGGDCGTLNEDDSTVDSELIEARAQDIAAFVDAGGGVLALSAGAHGDGQRSGGADVYYAALPTPPLRTALRGPFTLGPFGTAIGVTDGTSAGTSDEINCARCSRTHNAFDVADDDPVWRVIVRGADGLARAVATTARERGGVLAAGPTEIPAALPDPAPVVAEPRPSKAQPATEVTLLVTDREVVAERPRACVSRRRFRIRVRGLGVRLRTALVRVRGREVPVVRRAGRLTAIVDLRGQRRGRFTATIEATTTQGRTLSGARRYWTCRKKLPGSIPRI